MTFTRDYPTVYAVDGDVDLSLYDDYPGGSNPFPRPEVGYGSSFTTRDDLVELFNEWFETTAETGMFVSYLIDQGLIQYEQSISGFVVTYRLYDETDFWLQCMESFEDDSIASIESKELPSATT